MRHFALRLHPADDLLEGLLTATQGLDAACVVTCVGSLVQVSLRLANRPGAVVRQGHFEIVSLVGTFSPDGPHLHMAVSDGSGATVGGHVMPGNRIYTTAEVVLADLAPLRFTRPVDPATGWDELAIEDGRS